MLLHDRYPGAPRILFVGRADSSHARAWIDLLDGVEINARMFSIPASLPPPDAWSVPTYVAAARHNGRDSSTREYLVSSGSVVGPLQRLYGSRVVGSYREYAMRWLAEIVRTWRPHVVHTQSLVTGGSFYDETCRTQKLATDAVWVLQLWGGADLWCADGDVECRSRIDHALRSCDQLFDDNASGIAYARSIGVRAEQIAQIGSIPGNGGIDFDALDALRGQPPSRRTSILWPKAYDTPWSRPAPVLEALKRVLPELGSATVDVLVACDATLAAIEALPDEMRRRFVLHGLVERRRVLELLSSARVMLAPSFVDGVPNVMLEAMALGAMPIMSPLETIAAVVDGERNVLFARNDDPDAIAAAIARSMRDDDLVERAAVANVARARELADRSVIRKRVLDYYSGLIHPIHVVDHEH